MREKIIKQFYFKGYLIAAFNNISNVINYLFSEQPIKYGMLLAINAEKIINAKKNKKLHNLLLNAEFLYADGISIVLGIKCKYWNAKIIRIPGIDLWYALMKHAGIKNIPVFLIGNTKQNIKKTKYLLKNKWNTNIVGIQDGYFKYEKQKKIFFKIQNSGAKIITVGLGSPKQEFFINECKKIYPHALYMGVGGTYDIFIGNIKRAPKIWQKFGLEWLYRLKNEPHRIKRYLKIIFNKKQ